MSERVAVVIPYFQRKPGLLARSLRSVFHQRCEIDPWVIVVDDDSPVPAAGEIDALDPALRASVRLIHQPNSGAGHARNTGLDAVPDDVAYVAFLDPDDIWDIDHIEQATVAMRLGYDFYFCDQRTEDDPTGNFPRCGLNPADHKPILSHPDLYEVTGDFFDQLLHHSPVPTSAAVLRRARLGHLRFCDRLRPVGEDLLFWLDVSRETQRIAFSTRTSLIYGEGVSGSWARDWVTEKSLTIINAYTNYYAEVGRRFHLNPSQDKLVKDRLHLSEAEFAFTFLGMLRRGRWPASDIVIRYLLRNPRLLIRMPQVLVARLTGRVS